MYKLVAIDLDGTLLNSYGEVTNENRKAIDMVKNKNIQIVLASGRPIKSVENLANELQISKYIICGNGSIVYDTQSKEIIYNKFLDKSKVLKIIKICEENSIYYSVYTTDTILVKSLNYNTLFYNFENSTKPESKKTNMTIMQDIYEYVEKSQNQNYLKITVSDSDKVIFGSIIRKLRMIKDIDVLDVAHMSKKIIKDGTVDVPVEYFYTEITSTNVDKWNAIVALIDYLNIKKEEVIAIGDNVNDKEMIQNAKVGVVMGNSAPYIKDIADIVVSDNNNSGVAEALKKIVIE